MTKAELLRDLDNEYKGFEQILNDIGEARMEQPGVAGHWSVKDIVAHISSWRERTVQRLESAATGKPLPPKPWPDNLTEDDPINAWFYEREHAKPVKQVLSESRQMFDRMRAAIAAIPEADLMDPSHFPWLEGNPLTARNLFSHYHDEHEADMRAWLAKQKAA